MIRKYTKNEPKMPEIDETIIDTLFRKKSLSRAALQKELGAETSNATFKRSLQRLVSSGRIEPVGKGRATQYTLSPMGELLSTMDVKRYFSVPGDMRSIHTGFNFRLLDELLPKAEIFTPEDLEHLLALQAQFELNLSLQTPSGKKKEMRRLGIDLSWKSSQIEGNTYTLLETEQLLLNQREATGKTREEATMLLNHKKALDFILEEPAFLSSLSVAHIEHIHSLLTEDMGVERNIRRSRVGITGTNYRPLDNEFQIREALESTCRLVNASSCVFTKALLTLVLLSYIQAFMDGNKRTARICANGILIAHGYCPLSFRSVDPIDYKMAMLLFYERNNISAFKRIFMEQVEFAVASYF